MYEVTALLTAVHVNIITIPNSIHNRLLIMRFAHLALVTMTISSVSVLASTLQVRQSDCEKQYGSYPEYTGPCKDTSECVNGHF